MKNLKSSAKFLLAISTFVVLFTSCTKDEVNPDYVGTWATEVSTSESGIIFQMKDILSLSADGFSRLTQLYDESSKKYVDIVKMNGTLAVKASIMDLTINEFGFSTINPLTSKYTGTIVTIKKGDKEFDSMFKQLDQTLTTSADYSVSGNKLTIFFDENEDGIYSEDEKIVYTKQ